MTNKIVNAVVHGYEWNVGTKKDEICVSSLVLKCVQSIHKMSRKLLYKYLKTNITHA